jgi:hypothetical protein
MNGQSEEGFIQFKAITKKDVELVRTVSLMAHMEDPNYVIRDKITKMYETDPSNIEQAFAYGLYNYLLVVEKNDMMLSKIYIENALEAFNHILSIEPGYWLVRTFRNMILLSLPNSIREDDQILDELLFVVESQKRSNYQPYFVIPHIMIAEFYFGFPKKTEAEKYINMAFELPKEPILALGDFLILPFVSFKTKLRGSGEIETADKIVDLGRSFFPNEYHKLLVK